MQVYYPPVGIAHISHSISDLLEDRLHKAKSLQCAFITQPKPNPHLGTVIVLMVTFAVAKHLQRMFNLRTRVLIDMLDNSPAKTFVQNGKEYSLCLSHSIVADGIPASEYNMRPIFEISNLLEELTGIKYKVRRYKDIQSDLRFREGMIEILRRREEFIPIVSPSERRLRMRPICKKCGLVDKRALSVEFHDDKERPYLSAVCPNCGSFRAYLLDSNDVIDANTPVRTILRSVAFIEQFRENGTATVIVNGKDWAGVWMQRVYFDGLALFGYAGRQIPMNLFSPLILDESGAKLSKTIYLQENAYSHLDPVWVSAEAFIQGFGEMGVRRLFTEVTSWVEDPRKFFRDYSISYIQSLFNERWK